MLFTTIALVCLFGMLSAKQSQNDVATNPPTPELPPTNPPTPELPRGDSPPETSGYSLLGGVDAAEDAVDDYGSARFRPDDNHRWAATLTIDGQNVGSVVGRGRRDDWESMRLTLSFDRGAPIESAVKACTALLRALVPAFSNDSFEENEKAIAAMLEASLNVPARVKLVREYAGWKITVDGAGHALGFYSIDVDSAGN